MSKKFKPLLIILMLSLALSGCSSESAPDTDVQGFTKDDIIYFIMVDRFADSDPIDNPADVDKSDLRAFQGGDLEGIIDKLDYIKSTGATSIWLTPIMTNGPNGYHGYWIYDFYSVDPHFGDMETFKRLVEEAHSRDIKVILDYIVNHTGYDSPWLDDPQKVDWFNPDRSIRNWKDPEEVELGWLAGLPDLDQTNPEVESYFIENALWWIDETGIDGFRLDTVRHVPEAFWEKFTQTIKEKHPHFFFLGEVWDENTKKLESYHQTGIDSITNYSLYAGIKNAFNPMPNMFSLVNAFSKEEAFSSPDLNALFIDNHDNPRYISLNPKYGEEYMLQALTFLYTYPGIPVLYYGTEISMTGGGDPENRQFMDWERAESHSTLDYVRTLSELRAEFLDAFNLIQYEKEYIVYEISKNDKKLLILINASSKEKDIAFDYEAKALINHLTGEISQDFSANHFSKSASPFEILFFVVE
ncbi:MAG: alpha-amylase [Clostridia bacterium]|nr:alpha-amylase [Clostridia bacterium]